MYYTSGTTGRPKGVLLSHALVLHHATGTILEMKLNSQDVWLHAAPMFHLVDAFAIYAITLVGGRHVMLPTFSARAALIAIERERVTCSNMASTMAAWMSTSPLASSLDLSSLRVVSCGGSPQADSVIHRCIACFGCEFFVSYGMTECCGKISMSILPQEWRKKRIDELRSTSRDPGAALSSPQELVEIICTSGRPFLFIKVRVVAGLDEEDRSVSDKKLEDIVPGSNQAGEILIRGPTCFDGYWRRKQGFAADVQSFVVDGEGDRWFRTGDLALLFSNRYLKVVDRAKGEAQERSILNHQL